MLRRSAPRTGARWREQFSLACTHDPIPRSRRPTGWRTRRRRILVVWYLPLTIGLAALSLWITYTVIWRAARRGLREFHYPGIKMKGLSAQSLPGRR